MKQILILFILFNMAYASASAQWCTGVTVQVIGANPQSGPVNVWGVQASIQAEYVEDITITGYIYSSADPHVNHEPFSMTIYKGSTEASTGLFYQTGPADDGEIVVESITPCPEVMSYYAGVYITYETANGLLRFNSANDFNTLLDALDNDDETFNQNYENQYPNLTADQLDDMDEQTGFDEFAIYREFEQLFTGFYSKRQEIEDVENAWLASDLATTNPEAYDLTADDALNSVLSSTGAFKIGGDRYELTASGFFINGVQQDVSHRLRIKSREELAAAKAAREAFYGNINLTDRIGLADAADEPDTEDESWTHPTCKSNKKVVEERVIGSEMYKLKVALNSVGVRSSAKTKIVHYKRKNSKWKRSRARLAVYLAGTIYTTPCTFQFSMSERKPAGGYKKRKQLKLVERGWGIVWRTLSSQINGSFEQDNGNHYSVVLNF